MSGYGLVSRSERFGERHDLVLLRIGQAQLTYRHVKVVGNLGIGQRLPFRSFCRAVPEVTPKGNTSLVL